MMAESIYTIFYSWQSDLPNSETRGLIQSSIDAAIKGLRNTVSVVADRDTEGVYGSPDIVQTILSKIDECDIFVADVSSVTVYHPLDKDGEPTKRLKAAPNPNVLLELGYATQVVGWDNIICIMNEDYNQGGEIPFDIEHHRLTSFSLKDIEKKDVRRELRDIISSTVLNLMENGKRVRPNFSNIRVGSFNVESNSVESKLTPLDVHFSPSVQKTFALLRDNGKILVEDVLEIILPPAACEDDAATSHSKPKPAERIIRNDGSTLTPVESSFHFDLFKAHRVEIKNEDRVHLRDSIKKLFSIEISDSFFEFGGLKKRNIPGIQSTYELEGTSEEKDKYDKYIELGGIIALLDMWEMYLESFNGYILIPLAVANESSISDSDIKIYVEINPDTAEVVFPTSEIINPDMRGIEGDVYEEDLIKNTLLMDESPSICYDTDLSISAQHDIQASVYGGINGTPRYNAEDYERELSKYIAVPIDGSQTSFCFEISSLHARETKWVGALIMVKPLNDKIELTYSVKSYSSDGALAGKLDYSTK